MDALSYSPTSFPFTMLQLRLVATNNCSTRQKCNRANPCEACIRSGDEETCSYTSNGPRDDEQILSNDSREDTLMARIDRLEQLLMSVMANGTQYPPPGAIDNLQSTTLSNDRPESLGSKIKLVEATT